MDHIKPLDNPDNLEYPKPKDLSKMDRAELETYTKGLEWSFAQQGLLAQRATRELASQRLRIKKLEGE